MGRKRYRPEQVFWMVRESEVHMAQGHTAGRI
jgi:hypothetical protein